MVAAVDDCRPRRRLRKAVEAQVAVAIEGGRRADETLVVNRLHDGHAGGTAGVISRRRNQWKKFGSEQHPVARPRGASRACDASAGPDRVGGHRHAVHVGDALIVLDELDDRVPVLAQQLRLEAEDRVFTSSLKIVVVNHQNTHRRACLAPTPNVNENRRLLSLILPALARPCDRLPFSCQWKAQSPSSRTQCRIDLPRIAQVTQVSFTLVTLVHPIDRRA